MAFAIALSGKPSSFGAISRLNQASSRWPGCSRAQLRLRRCPSLIASPRARFTTALRRGSSPAAERLREACRDRPQAFAPMWQRECEFVRERRRDPACATCGEPVLKRRRRHCEACMPKARRKHGLRAIEAARKVLAAQTAAGNDPRCSADVNRARGEAISDGHRRNRTWARENPGQGDGGVVQARDRAEARCVLAEIGKATGLSLAACSRIRVGAKVPHPRHWDCLLALVEAGTEV